MNSYSQAGQDRWAFEVSGQKRDGVFLDVGANDGFTNSNTRGLEEQGWRGLLVDIQFLPQIASRPSQFEICDARAADWSQIIKRYSLPNYIDYLSLDVDESTTETLKQILRTGVVFGCATVEHDIYRLGARPQDLQRHMLLACDYDLVCSDVIIEPGPGIPGQGGPFEDWYCHKSIEESRRNRFRCHAQIGRTIVPP